VFVALILAQAAGEAPKQSNPILPSANELVWGSLSFIVLFIILAKVGYPAIKKGMDARAERIRASLADAEKAKDEAQSILEEYRRQLADARSEASRIIDEARQAADKVRQDLTKKAEADAAEIKRRAQEDITAQANRTMADLQARVALLAVELAEKVVEKNLDPDTNRQLIDRYIQQVGSNS
jgi:F-type H+-transporting ATPase subunit b